MSPYHGIEHLVSPLSLDPDIGPLGPPMSPRPWYCTPITPRPLYWTPRAPHVPLTLSSVCLSAGSELADSRIKNVATYKPPNLYTRPPSHPHPPLILDVFRGGGRMKSCWAITSFNSSHKNNFIHQRNRGNYYKTLVCYYKQ